MKYLRIYILAITTSLLCVFVLPNDSYAQVHGQFSPIHEMSDSQLEDDLREAMLFRILGNSRKIIDRTDYCGKLREEVSKARKKRLALNVQHKETPLPDYRENALRLDRESDIAINQYKQCFSSKLQEFPELTTARIYSYDSHEQKFDDLKEWFVEVQEVKDINAYIKALKKELENPAFVVTVTAFVGQVEYLRNGKQEEWQPVSEGTVLNVNDQLRTGHQSLAELKYRDKETNAIVFYLDPGPNTTITIVDFYKAEEERVTANLIDGVIRFFTYELWAQNERSIYSVRAGTTILGIRNTEVTLSYDPRNKRADALLHHGDAFIEVNGKETTLKPRTSVTVINERVSPPQEVSLDMLQQITAVTTIPKESSLTTSEESVESNTAELFGIDSKNDKSPDPAPKNETDLEGLFGLETTDGEDTGRDKQKESDLSVLFGLEEKDSDEILSGESDDIKFDKQEEDKVLSDLDAKWEKLEREMNELEREMKERDELVKSLKEEKEEYDRNIENDLGELTDVKKGKGLAEVYIIRKTGINMSAVPIKVLFDGEVICKLKNKRYILKLLEPGNHTFHLVNDKKVKNRKEMNLDLKPGGVYYLDLDVKSAVIKNKMKYNQLDREEGEELLYKLKHQDDCKID